jgi:(S)-2-hydroxyglutarate dehydrogenase
VRPGADRRYDVTVVGGGLIGLATAYRLLEAKPGLRLAVLEKEPELARHQSGHNSGVIHAGLYYTPGSLKARLCREGMEAVKRFADEREIPYELCGKLVVALDENELAPLAELKRRGIANGLRGLQEVDAKAIRELEPHATGIRGLHVPETGIIDFRRVALAYADEVRAGGGEILLGSRVIGLEPSRNGGRSATLERGGPIHAENVIACAGLHSDRVATLTGSASPAYRIAPFRGDYYTLAPAARSHVRGLIYPVLNPSFPFLGVHFTRRIDGVVWAGPNAVPAFAREGYLRRDVNLRDLRSSIGFPGFRRLAREYARTGAAEMWRDYVKWAFVRELQRYVPKVRSRDLRFGPTGVRAQCMSADGKLIEDFLLEEADGVLHVLNAPSPGATASLAIGRMLAEKATAAFGL